MRALAPGLHDLSTLAPGDHWRTGEVEVTAAMIDGFAALTLDASALHLDEAAARAMGFPGRVAHGLLVVSLLEGLKSRAPVQIATHTALGWEIGFRAPVLAGDLLQGRIVVEEVRRIGPKGHVTLAVEGWTKALAFRAKARYFGHFTR